jgi:hypothetical protein
VQKLKTFLHNIKMKYKIDKLDNRLLIIRFENRDIMNKTLSKISKRYEQIEAIAEGYNFPAEFVEKTDEIYDFVRKNKIEYVIGVYSGKSISHEKLHAKYYLDEDYKRQIDDEWAELDAKKREKIIDFLKKLGYCDKVIVDEYQAYRYSEKANFFGVKL